MEKYLFVSNPELRSYLLSVEADKRIVEGGKAIYLDRNEHPYNLYGQRYKQNRFIEPTLWELKVKIANIYGVSPENIFIQNGHWQALDTILRIFMKENFSFAHISPTFEYIKMLKYLHNFKKVYSIGKEENFVENVKELRPNFVFLPNPNDPTSTGVYDIKKLLEFTDSEHFIYLDERYIEFSDKLPSLVKYASEKLGLIVLRSFAYAYALAGLNLSFIVAHTEIIEVLNKLSYPDNVSRIATQYLLEVLEGEPIHNDSLMIIKEEIKKLYEELKALPIVKKVDYPEGNFIRVYFEDNNKVWKFLKDKKIFVHKEEEALRISVGNPTENKYLIRILQKLF